MPPEKEVSTRLRLIPDTAWGEFAGTESEPCELGFEGYAETLSNVALNTQGPFTIGVFGDWGTGKSSLMRLIKTKVEAGDNIVTVWFNAWQYEKEENPLVPLLTTIITRLKELDPAGTVWTDLIGAGESLLRSLKVKLGPIELDTKNAFEEAEQKELILGVTSFYMKAFEALEKTAQKLSEDHRIIVFIDDLDRCLLDKALDVLEYIKLVLAQPGFIFFLGLDRRIIEAYLKKRFQKDYEVPNFSGREYLDKLVQLSFKIPSHARRIEDFAKSMVNRVKNIVSNEEAEQLEAITPIFGLACNSNPRTVIRYLNSLLVARAIARATGNLTDLPLSLFAISLALQERWETIHARIQGYEITESIIDYLEFDELKRESLKEDEQLKSDLKLRRIVELLIEEESLRKLLSTDPGEQYLRTSIENRLAATEFLSTTTTREEPEINFLDELRERWPWAEGYDDDGWPIIRGCTIKPDVNLEGADLFGANLFGAKLEGAKLEGANLEGTILEGANLKRANLEGAILQRAKLFGANLEGTILKRANLEGANLEGANLEGANLEGAKLFSARLFNTNLRGADLFGANLEHANLFNANLEGANLFNANLEGANLEHANLFNAKLEGANLEGANLEGAYLEGANLESANLGRTKLSSSVARMKEITKWSVSTIWPKDQKST